jgi:hypothetical protein
VFPRRLSFERQMSERSFIVGLDVFPQVVTDITAFTLGSFSPYSSTIKIQAICFSETSFDFQRTTRRYNPRRQNCSKLHSFILYSVNV